MNFMAAHSSAIPPMKCCLSRLSRWRPCRAIGRRPFPCARAAGERAESHRMSQFLSGRDVFQGGGLRKGRKQFKAASENPIGELTSAVALGWTRLAAGDADGALKAVDLRSSPNGRSSISTHHRALIADVAGRRRVGNRFTKRCLKAGQPYLRPARRTLGSGPLWRYQAGKSDPRGRSTRTRGRSAAIARYDGARRYRKREGRPFLVSTSYEGWLRCSTVSGGDCSPTRVVSVIGTLYLQMALDVKHDHVPALAALAAATSRASRYTDAIATTIDEYDRPTTANAIISARHSISTRSTRSIRRKRSSKARDQNPKDVRPLEALGNILRARKQYADSVKYFTRAIALLGKHDPRFWGYYYARGTSYERLKNWPAAERIFKRALALAPDQPLVLNYLGYCGNRCRHRCRQALRYRVFYEEMGAKPSPEMARRRRDFDRIRRALRSSPRASIMRSATAPERWSALIACIRRPAREEPRPVLFRGRVRRIEDHRLSGRDPGARPFLRRCARTQPRDACSCCGAASRPMSSTTGSTLMFGCASLPGTDPDALALPLSYLHHHHLAPPALRPRACRSAMSTWPGCRPASHRSGRTRCSAAAADQRLSPPRRVRRRRRGHRRAVQHHRHFRRREDRSRHGEVLSPLRAARQERRRHVEPDRQGTMSSCCD